VNVSVAGVIGGVAANRTRALSLRRVRGFVFSDVGWGTSSSIDGRGVSDFEGMTPAFAVEMSGVSVVVGITTAGRD